MRLHSLLRFTDHLRFLAFSLFSGLVLVLDVVEYFSCLFYTHLYFCIFDLLALLISIVFSLKYLEKHGASVANEEPFVLYKASLQVEIC